MLGLQRANIPGITVKLISKNSNLCDHNSPTSQTDRQTTCDRNTALCTKVHPAVKKRSNAWYSAPSTHGHHKGAQVHGAHQAASRVPALYLSSYSRYSLPTPRGWRVGWVSPGPGCKEQLAHGCYATARSQRTRTRGRWSSALTTRPPRHPNQEYWSTGKQWPQKLATREQIQKG